MATGHSLFQYVTALRSQIVILNIKNNTYHPLICVRETGARDES